MMQLTLAVSNMVTGQPFVCIHQPGNEVVRTAKAMSMYAIKYVVNAYFQLPYCEIPCNRLKANYSEVLL